MRRLHLIRDVEHAHSPGIDVAIFDCRELSGRGRRLDVLGKRAEDVQVASDAQAIPQQRSRRIGDLDSVVRYRVLRAMLGVCFHRPSFAIFRKIATIS